MLKVLEIAFIGYPATDMARTRAFYEGILNLTPATTFDHDGKQWIEYELGPHVLAVSNMAGDQWKPSPDGPGVALEVENFDEAIAHLRAHNVTFVLEPTESPVCRMALISDPDGNTINIHKRNAA
jgi:predicted enzyme related to lactoylglutathione lyase